MRLNSARFKVINYYTSTNACAATFPERVCRFPLFGMHVRSAFRMCNHRGFRFFFFCVCVCPRNCGHVGHSDTAESSIPLTVTFFQRCASTGAGFENRCARQSESVIHLPATGTVSVNSVVLEKVYKRNVIEITCAYYTGVKECKRKNEGVCHIIHSVYFRLFF